MFSRFRQGDYQNSSDTIIGTCNGDGLAFFTSGDFLVMSFENLLSWLYSKEFTVGDSMQGG